jgi:NADH dehydrogenase FAD-containing subunit
MGDAVRLRSHHSATGESGSITPLNGRLFVFVIIGGGFSGVELAGEVNDLIRESTHIEIYRR